MKIIDIYDRTSDLKCHGKNIFEVTDKYLDMNFPSLYRVNYDINLADLRLFLVDEFTDDSAVARYIDKTNTIVFTKKYALGHEMFHVTGMDKKNNKSSLNNRLGIQEAMEEGMTEYLHMKAYGLSDATTYFFEVFCVMMLDSIPELFKPYFMPAESDFCKLFPQEKDAYSLLYSLDTYYQKHSLYVDMIIDNKKDMHTKVLIERAVMETLDNLINIELSFNKSIKELNMYGDKFLDLLKSSNLRRALSVIYPNYMEYAEEQIKKKIRIKR